MFRLFQPRKRRHSRQGRGNDKTDRLYEAACRLLADRDYEQIPVARFAEQAEMSVGSLYQRFTNKDAYLDSVVAIRCAELRRRMAVQLDPTDGAIGPMPR